VNNLLDFNKFSSFFASIVCFVSDINIKYGCCADVIRQIKLISDNVGMSVIYMPGVCQLLIWLALVIQHAAHCVEKKKKFKFKVKFFAYCPCFLINFFYASVGGLGFFSFC
jgi:hypothetical protein